MTLSFGGDAARVADSERLAVVLSGLVARQAPFARLMMLRSCSSRLSPVNSGPWSSRGREMALWPDGGD